MAYPEKRAGKLTGFWYGEVFIKKNGERFRKRFASMKEAKGYEAYTREVGAEPTVAGAPDDNELTFSDVVQAYRKAHPDTGRDKSGANRLNWLEDFLGAIPAAHIGTADLDRVVVALQARMNKAGTASITTGTINRYLTSASAVLKFGATRKLIKAKPEVPWKKEAGRRIEYFSEAQEAALVRCLTEQGHLGIALGVEVLCATGLRWGEFITLEPHQCQGEWIKLDKTKTDTPRDVPINAELCGELRALVASKGIPNYLSFSKHFRAAVKACGYSPKLGIHNCRHTAATRLVKTATPLPIVQKFLGHKNITTTMLYTHVEDADLLEAMKKLSPRRGKAAPEAPQSDVLPFMKSTG